MTEPSGGSMPAQNQAIMERLRADHEWLADHGVVLSQWGPDPVSGKVKVYLVNFTEAGRDLLMERYGSAIAVSTESRKWRTC